jgi:hypothetical protein
LDTAIVPRSLGVYKLRWAENGRALAIPRAASVDSEGLLYIGISYKRTLSKRISELTEALLENKHKRHSVRRPYHDFGFKDVFPSKQIEIQYCEEIDPRNLEKDLLQDYLRKYKDKPPLNFTFSRKLDATI